ncbi:MAG: response regulator [Proteobacteria bacterium]|nr:MAG: response regulator [Pseudomonadota bacterium]
MNSTAFKHNPEDSHQILVDSCNANKEKVLLIDDDRVFGSIIKNTATHFGMNLDTLVDAPSRRKLTLIDDYDLLLLDYDLESTTGFAFAEVLNKAMPYMPIILISSSNRPTADKLFELPNIIGFVSKWTKPEEFFLRSLELYRNMPMLGLGHQAAAV